MKVSDEYYNSLSTFSDKMLKELQTAFPITIPQTSNRTLESIGLDAVYRAGQQSVINYIIGRLAEDEQKAIPSVSVKPKKSMEIS